MTNIEFVKWIIYGDLNAECGLTDSDIAELIENTGINSCIETIARGELIKLGDSPTQVNDGVVSMSWADRKTGLSETLRKAQNKGFSAPEGNGTSDMGVGSLYV